MTTGGFVQFALESEMIRPLRASLPGLLLPRGPYAMACEVPDGSRVVDIMCASIPGAGAPESELIAGKLSRLSVAQTMVLALVCRERRITTARLAAMTYIPQERLMTDYLTVFERLDLIERDRRSWAVGTWGELMPTRLVAIEAKLKDWKGALAQAHDNLSRADFSYVALPRIGDSSEKRFIREAKNLGVGVITLEPGGGVDVTLNARPAPSSISGRKWSLSIRLLADVLQPDGRWSLVTMESGA